MSGFTFPPVTLYMILPNTTPDAVPIENAITPRTITFANSAVMILSAVVVAPTETPRKIVTILQRAFCAVSERPFKLLASSSVRTNGLITP